MPHGGKRPGTGPKPRYAEASVNVRVPGSLRAHINELKKGVILGDVQIVGQAKDFTLAQLHEALKGAMVIANQAGARIRALEAALRVARGYVQAQANKVPLEQRLHHSAAAKDLQALDELLGLVKREPNEKST